MFGGFAPYFVSKLISLTGNAMAPSWYLMFCGVASLLAFPEERLD
ncbi:hypothetical protein [uncultured Aquitalea sp.]|nr:hypothetical protein [uncultured Aquitalea sp.]